MNVRSMIDTIHEDNFVEERLGVEALAMVINNFKGDGVEDYDKIVSILEGKGSYIYSSKKFDLDL